MRELKESVQNYVKKKEELIALYNDYNARIKNYDDILGRFKTNRTLSTPKSTERPLYLSPFLVNPSNLSSSNNPEYILRNYENKYTNCNFAYLRGQAYFPNYYGKYNKTALTNFFENIASRTFDQAIEKFNTLPNSYEALNNDVNKVIHDEIDPNMQTKISMDTFKKSQPVMNHFNQIKKGLISLRNDYVKNTVSLYLSCKKGHNVFFWFCVGLIALSFLAAFLTGEFLPIILSLILGVIGLLSSFIPKKDFNNSKALKIRQNEQTKLVNNIDSLLSAYQNACQKNSDFLFNIILGDELMPYITEKEQFINGYIDALTMDYQENVEKIKNHYDAVIEIGPDIIKFLDQIQPEEFDDLLLLSLVIKEEKDLINVYHQCKAVEKQRLAYEEQLRHQRRLEEESRRHNIAMEQQASFQNSELKKQTELAKKATDYQRKQAEAAKDAAYQQKAVADYQKAQADYQKKQADYAKKVYDMQKEHLNK